MSRVERVVRYPKLSPIAPDFLWLISKRDPELGEFWGKIEAIATKEAIEFRCKERVELCQILSEIDPENPTWKYGIEFFQAYPQGEKAVWELLNKWKVFTKDGSLKPPEGMEEAHPTELMDLDKAVLNEIISASSRKLSEDEIKNLHQLAKSARDASFNQYDLVKEFLPFLCRDYVTAVIGADLEAPKCLIGMSPDEMRMYAELTEDESGQIPPPLLGINRSHSPLARKEMEKGSIKEAPTVNGVVRADNLEPGKVYTLEHDITKGLPIESGEWVIGMLYVLHHIPQPDRANLIRMLYYYSKKIDGDPNKPGIAIFEALSSKNLAAMVLKVNGPHRLGTETACFDALLGTTIRGGQTPTTFTKAINDGVPEIDCKEKIRIYQKLPDTIEGIILPHQQIGFVGYL